MSWMQKLYRTYEYVQEQGLDDENLALPFHMSKAVHLKVILNDKAELVGAEPIKKQLPIQITEDSSKRSGSTIAPYALHDGLQYIAKTAEKYLTIEYLNEIAKKKAPQKGGKKWQEFLAGTDEDKQKFTSKEKEKYKKCFESYESQLSGWAKFGNLQEIEIVLQYIQKGSLIEDLLDKEIFSFKDNILLSEKDNPFDLTIVWAVEISGQGDLHSDLWDKPCIQNQWIEYQESLIQKSRHKSLCCITGDLDYPTEAYPKINGNAKLVSADGGSAGFIFRGRFYGDKDNGAKSELGSQAVILGKNASHKAFSTLKWLINRQGIRNGKQVILIWSSNCISDEDKLLSSLYWEEDDIYASLLSEDKVDHSANLGFETAEQLKKKLHGYKEKLASGESIFVQSDEKKTDGMTSLKSRAESEEYGLGKKAFQVKKGIEGSKQKDQTKNQACQKWFDVRAFGQVFAFGKGDEGGSGVSIAIRGPVTIQSAFSVVPISITSNQIVKSVDSDEKEGKNARMGMKHRVDHGVYIAFGAMSPQLAERTGFSDGDAEKIKAVLTKLFEGDASSARPEGSMQVLKLIWWEHNSKAGQYSSAKVHGKLKEIIEEKIKNKSIDGLIGDITEEKLTVTGNGASLKPEILDGF